MNWGYVPLHKKWSNVSDLCFIYCGDLAFTKARKLSTHSQKKMLHRRPFSLARVHCGYEKWPYKSKKRDSSFILYGYSPSHYWECTTPLRPYLHGMSQDKQKVTFNVVLNLSVSILREYSFWGKRISSISLVKLVSLQLQGSGLLMTRLYKENAQSWAPYVSVLTLLVVNSSNSMYHI